MLVNDLLVQQFGDIVDLDFTASLEDKLDEVAQGERQWVPVVQEFYEPLNRDLERANTEVERIKPAEIPTDEVCSQGHPMVIKEGRFGRFLACTNYPEHKETRPLPEELPPGRARGVLQPRRADAAPHGSLRPVLHVDARVWRNQAVRAARRRAVSDRRRRDPGEALEEGPHLLRLRQLARLRLGVVQSAAARAVPGVRRPAGRHGPRSRALPEARGRAAALRRARAQERLELDSAEPTATPTATARPRRGRAQGRVVARQAARPRRSRNGDQRQSRHATRIATRRAKTK